MKDFYLGILCTIGSATLATASSQPVIAQAHFKKVFIVVLENSDYDNALKQPYLSSLAKQGVLLTNFYAVSHPSQPNYLAMVSGSTFGVQSNKNIDLPVRHIGDLLDEKKLSWKVYAEQYPSDCFKGERSGKY